MYQEVTLLSVNAGSIKPLGERRGREVLSGFNKTPVERDWVYLGHEGLWSADGAHRLDFQADERVINGKRVHGGPLKALYAFSIEHYPVWSSLLNRPLLPGALGENLTISGVTEREIVIGERWTWGVRGRHDIAVIEVTGPRRPCFKFDLRHGAGAARAMMDNGLCGWYFSVVRPGLVPTSGPLRILHRPARSMTIADAFREKVRRDPTVPDMPDN